MNEVGHLSRSKFNCKDFGVACHSFFFGMSCMSLLTSHFSAKLKSSINKVKSDSKVVIKLKSENYRKSLSNPI